jgi:diguanylate cyclase (GGDEF)-like protein
VRVAGDRSDLSSEFDDETAALAERWLAYLVAGPGVVAFFNAFMGFAEYDIAGLVGIGLGAFLAAGLLLRSHGRLPRGWLHVLVVAGAAGIGAGIHFTDGVPNAASMLYLWVALYAFYFFSRRAAVLHLVVVGISYAVPIALRPPPFSPVAHWATTVGVLKGRLDDSVDRLEVLAATDALTGLPNRRGWTMRARAEINRASRGKQELAVALIDLDHFKAFNDEHGHAAGDALLHDCADAWQDAIRELDFLARLGGDEFALLLPGCDPACAAATADRLRSLVPADVGCSIGIAQWHPGQTIRDTLGTADAALYEAKRARPQRPAARV